MLLPHCFPILARGAASIPSFAASFFTLFVHCSLPTSRLERVTISKIAMQAHISCKVWDGSNPAHIKEAAAALKSGLPVAFPTETVYGLGALAIDDEAVARVFAAKGRPSDNPLIVHVADGEAGLRKIALDGRPPEIALRLGRRFWPGPLSICVRANKAAVGHKARAGLDTVAIRVPDHPVALALLRELGGDVPVAAPSANASGRPSPTSAAHVLEDLGAGGRIAGVVDGGAAGKGECGVGIESTVVDCSTDHVVVLRPGKITREELEAFLGIPVVLHSLSPSTSHQLPSTPSPATTVTAAANGAAGVAEGHIKGGRGGAEAAGSGVPKAPGMKYRHYAPRAPMRLCGSEEELVRAAAAEAEKGVKVGVMAPAAVLAGAVHASLAGKEWVGLRCGETEDDLDGMAQDLYGALRGFDAAGDVTLILALEIKEEGMGAALMNRLRKAAMAHADVAPSS